MKNKIIFIIGIIIGLMISVTVTYAAVVTIIKSSEVTYDNSKSHGSEVTVQGALDELYKKAKELSGDLGHVYKEEILNGADPVLKDPLIPVTIAADGTVKYANINSKWYSYSEKNWANAVILVDKPSKSYNVGDIISESDIESYFVWIPRYRYQLWDLGEYTNAKDLQGLIDDGLDNDGEDDKNLSVRKLFNYNKAINIKFETIGNETKDGVSGECSTPLESGGKGSCNIGDWITHPAFINMNTNGLWVGKFETGYNQNSDPTTPITDTSSWTTDGAQIDEENKDKIIVKPNVYSWRNITIKNMFYTSYNYNRNLDSHMMKNTEWGAVAYLSHSAYGIAKEVNINNSSNKTGYSSDLSANQNTVPGTFGTSADTQPYNTPTGYLASTTGNITGVYDMSGGTWENMASLILNNPGGSELTIEEINNNSKYFDLYNENSTETSYNYRILGDATGEMGPFFSYYNNTVDFRTHNQWYHEEAVFLHSTSMWSTRGGEFMNGILAGQFDFQVHNGENNNSVGFRLVLAVK